MTHVERHVLRAVDIMTTRVVTVAPDIEIHEAIAVLVKRGISGAPVCDARGEIVGVLSGKDCLRVMASESFFDELAGRVSEFMTEKVETITTDTDIFRISGLFLNNHFRRLPVCEGRRLVGIVSRGDVLKGIQTMQRQLELQRYPDYRRPDAPEKLG